MRIARCTAAPARFRIACSVLATLAACDAGAGSSDRGRDSGGSAAAAPAGRGGASGASTAPVSGSGGRPGFDGLPEPDVDAIFEAGCATSTQQSQLLPSNLLFVIDRSSSMACNAPPTTESEDCERNPVRFDATLASKWEITRDALLDAIQALPDETVVGVSYFSNDDGCGVHSVPSVGLGALDDGQRSAIQASLSNVQPSGATPLVGAVILAYRHLHQEALARHVRGNKFVVLLTDGEQSEVCSDSERCTGTQECTDLLIDDEVTKAAGAGVDIKTFVIGAPGSEPARTVLSRAALNGGTAPPGCDPELDACHFDMTMGDRFEAALATALTAISGRALSCELAIPPPARGPVNPSRLNVVFSPGDGGAPRVIPRDDRAPCDAGADGWQHADEASKLRLCGPACERARLDRGARLDVVLGCAVRGPD